MTLKVVKEVSNKDWTLQVWLGYIAEYWDDEPFEFNGIEYRDIDDFEKDYPSLVRVQPSYHNRKTIWLNIDINTGKVLNWPEGVKHEFYDAKIVDTGRYVIRDEEDNVMADLDGYVPVCLGEGGYGDYLEFEVNEDGYIADWRFTQSDYNEIAGINEGY